MAIALYALRSRVGAPVHPSHKLFSYLHSLYHFIKGPELFLFPVLVAGSDPL